MLTERVSVNVLCNMSLSLHNTCVFNISYTHTHTHTHTHLQTYTQIYMVFYDLH